MTLQLAGKTVGAGAPAYITFECGPTHNGLESAMRLVEAAARAGGDAVKFQIIDADRLVADPNLMISYGILKNRGSEELETVSEPLIEPLRRRMLSRDDWRKLKAHSDKLGLAFFATVGFPEEADFVASIGCASIKIASADIDHYPLISYAARTGLCIQLDTGHATIGEVEAAVDVIRREGNEKIVIHHCPSGYPAKEDGINLEIIPTLRRMFPSYPIAYSDHSTGWEMDIAAVALGAELIEKTITEDRATRSIEHTMSLEPDEAGRFVAAIRQLEKALGTCRRILSDEERTKRMGNRRSIHAAKNLAKGAKLSEADVDYRRPGFGITAGQAQHYFGRKLNRDVAAGVRFAPADFD
jgi:sialic acid synthase SpsE